MFHAVTQSRQASLTFIITQPGKTIQTLMNGPVTDGMDCETETGINCPAANLEKACAIQ